jgi:hypothetical protein
MTNEMSVLNKCPPDKPRKPNRFPAPHESKNPRRSHLGTHATELFLDATSIGIHQWTSYFKYRPGKFQNDVCDARLCIPGLSPRLHFLKHNGSSSQVASIETRMHRLDAFVNGDETVSHYCRPFWNPCVSFEKSFGIEE